MPYGNSSLALFNVVFIANKFAACYKHLAIYAVIVTSARNGKLLLLIMMMMMFINVNANYTLKTLIINSIVI